MKKLIVAAVAAAVIAPAASMASATMYGKIHATIGSYNNSNNSTNDKELNVADNSSRVGFKGSEDLGNGMKAVYDFQFGMDVDDNTESTGAALSGRHSYVGLAGGFGTVLIGRLSSPRKSVAMKTNFFTDRMGDLRSLNTAPADNGYLNNVLAYASPSMGGFSVTAAYTANAGANPVGGDNQDASAWSANAIYSNGGIMVGLGHTDLMDILGSNQTNTDTTIGASVKMGAAKVALSYTDSRRNGTNTDMASYNLGASFKMGSNVLLAQYNATNNDGGNNDAQQITVGLDHMMSKRTTVYAQASKVFNDSANNAGASYSAFSRAGGVAGPRAGDNASGFAVGLIHKF